MVTTALAVPIGQFVSTINQTSMNVATTHCGTISSADAKWMRHSTVDPWYGLANSWSEAADRGARGGSTTPIAQATAASVQIIAGNISARDRPCSASSGITAAPNAIPNGCAVWRTPITSPRWCGGNQPVTSRPLAVLALAAAMPPRNRNAATTTRESNDAAA